MGKWWSMTAANLRISIARTSILPSATVVVIFASARAEGTTTAMDLEVDLGLLPYSVESVDVRANALAVIDAARGIIADAGIGGDQRVRLRDHIQIEEPPSPVVMLGAATLFAVRTRPYLDLICLFTGRLNAA